MSNNDSDKTKQQALNSVQSKVLSRLKQELSFVSSYKNLDNQSNSVEKEIDT